MTSAVLTFLLDSLPPTPGSSFPTYPIIRAHSLHVVNGLFTVLPPRCIPGECGLFTHTSLSDHLTQYVHTEVRVSRDFTDDDDDDDDDDDEW